MSQIVLSGEDLEFAGRIAGSIMENIEKVLIGQHETIRRILTAMVAGGHVLLEDTPGTGKTVMAKSLARSIDGSFARIQFTPDLLPSDVTGLSYYNQKESAFVFRQGPLFTNILLADEINRATPRTQSALLECMEERQVTVDGVTYPLKPPFFVIATENPIESAGTFPLPEAQLDRFLMKLSMKFPDQEEEVAILNRFLVDEPLNDLTYVCTTEDLLKLNKFYRHVYVHPALMEYLTEICRATRTRNSVIAGVSPRGTIAFLRCSQAYAFLDGRGYVVPEDIKAMAECVLPHRIVTSRGFGGVQTTDHMIREILDLIPAPTEDFTRKEITT